MSVYNKDGLEPLLRALAERGVELLSTGGTWSFIEGLGLRATRVEDITSYPSILGGRVKTLHPKVFGGILARRDNEGDMAEAERYGIEGIDLVVVDLYPFEETVRRGASVEEVIEKIDIGGVSLIRAAAKNWRDVAVVPSREDYATLLSILREQGATTTGVQRRGLATRAFGVTATYDSAIHSWMEGLA